jgi:heme oxygenase
MDHARARTSQNHYLTEDMVGQIPCFFKGPIEAKPLLLWNSDLGSFFNAYENVEAQTLKKSWHAPMP